VASQAPPVVPPPPTSYHRVRPSHRPPPDPEGKWGKREYSRSNGLPGCPHTLHPPRRLRHLASTERNHHADQPLQLKGGDRGRGSSRGQTGDLLGCHPTHHAASATPCIAAGPSARRHPPPLNLVAVPPNPASLGHPLAGSGLLVLPGSASPPCVDTLLMGMSPNRICRPVA
jgi:hypothetical protein